MKLLVLNLLIILHLNFAYDIKIEPSQNEKDSFTELIKFDLADLEFSYFDQTSKREIQIEGFKLAENDLIILNKNQNNSSKYSRLKWYSIGYPRIVLNKLDNDIDNARSIFRFDQSLNLTF